MTFPLSKKAQEGQYSLSHPYGLQQKWLRILLYDHQGGHVAMEKNTNFGTESSDEPIFHISLFLRVFVLTRYDFRKSGKLCQLGGNGFWKASWLYFKTLQSFPCLTLPKKTNKGVISKILMRNFPQIMIFCLKFSK